ncbi:MAG: 3'(2'),5'-bisphosphate nucleotidase CysQ [Sphingomonadaceae bacterium]|nr:3'(2'),5'-bisphosphate nucleotidase CysQ [Sphingomonadaceae bacterium]
MLEAAAEAHRIFHSDFDSWQKRPGDPVTEADYAIDALLKARLLEARPAYGWLSEETEDSAERLACRRVWVVDAIDGTRDFLRGRTGWAVSVALVEDGAPMLAALTAPERGLVFQAERGAGATLNGERLMVQPRSGLPGCRVPADPGPARIGGVTVERVVKPNALALRLAMLAAGEADAVFQTKLVREIDIAAATLIASEAGALVTDKLGQPLAFNKPRPVMPGVAAAGPGLHAELLAALAGE